MTHRNNTTAVGTYRTLQGIGLLYALGHIDQWADFSRAPDGWAAYDASGTTWPVTEAEAAEIDARLEAKTDG